jgi:hypothetical protein
VARGLPAPAPIFLDHRMTIRRLTAWIGRYKNPHRPENPNPKTLFPSSHSLSRPTAAGGGRRARPAHRRRVSGGSATPRWHGGALPASPLYFVLCSACGGCRGGRPGWCSAGDDDTSRRRCPPWQRLPFSFFPFTPFAQHTPLVPEQGGGSGRRASGPFRQRRQCTTPRHCCSSAASPLPPKGIFSFQPWRRRYASTTARVLLLRCP